MIQKNDFYYKNSLDVAREFVQSVTIVDDKATYSGEGPVSSESFNAGEIIKKISEEGIVCSIYKFMEESDIDRIARISRRSDVTILDWKMNPIPGMPSASDDDETEDDERESKGYYTLEILKKVVSGEYNKFKLFVIYTDEIEFNRIIDEIKKYSQMRICRFLMTVRPILFVVTAIKLQYSVKKLLKQKQNM